MTPAAFERNVVTRRPRRVPGHRLPVLLPYHRRRRALFSVTTIARTLDTGFTYVSEALARLLASVGT
jgi:hypothetical protein